MGVGLVEVRRIWEKGRKNCDQNILSEKIIFY